MPEGAREINRGRSQKTKPSGQKDSRRSDRYEDAYRRDAGQTGQRLSHVMPPSITPLKVSRAEARKFRDSPFIPFD